MAAKVRDPRVNGGSGWNFNLAFPRSKCSDSGGRAGVRDLCDSGCFVLAGWNQFIKHGFNWLIKDKSKVWNSEELCQDLKTALGTTKWQGEGFDRRLMSKDDVSKIPHTAFGCKPEEANSFPLPFQISAIEPRTNDNEGFRKRIDSWSAPYSNEFYRTIPMHDLLGQSSSTILFGHNNSFFLRSVRLQENFVVKQGSNFKVLLVD
ncbi:hypothetical protein DM860_012421 [Cuscuta australis]|uniref:Uncharacterized protein n=1 Tax=Cuscuta australis TaxID=267555 RepID=A0A328DQV7_9ASTE|nr:hypothetical protein DM860_012421 [Cuscuta australis]